MFNLVAFYSLLHGPKVISPSVWVPVPLFSRKKRIALFLCLSKSWLLFPSSPTLPLLPCSPHFLHICSLVSHEINVLVPLFPQTPWRASVFEDTRKERSKRTIGLPILKLLARSTANKELLLKMTWGLYINLSDISQIEIMQGKVELFELNSDIYVTWMFILSASAA